jgi:transcriptional regulator with XRE-family HTH domain
MPNVYDMNTAQATREGIAAEVRAQMGRKRVTARALAKSIGISDGALSERLNGARPFNTDQLARIAEALDMDLLALFVAAESNDHAA